MNKLVKSIKEAVSLCGLKDGMTVSFHHHLRNGDFVLNMVMEEVAAAGVKDLTVNASSLFDAHAPLLDHIENGVVTGLSADYISAGVGRFSGISGVCISSSSNSQQACTQSLQIYTPGPAISRASVSSLPQKEQQIVCSSVFAIKEVRLSV